MKTPQSTFHQKIAAVAAPPSPESTTSTSPTSLLRWAAAGTKQTVLPELRRQRGIVVPLAFMNLAWFSKTTITTTFLGRLGELPLAGGSLGFSFANVTGLSVLTGLCAAMEPICGQAHGAKNYKLMHKTLFMVILLLLAASLPISFLWLNVDRILVRFGQQREIAELAKKYTTFILPDLAVSSFLFPLKAYLSSQGVILPILLSSAFAVALHLPLNFLLSKAKGLEGVSMAVWLSDLNVSILLAAYVVVTEMMKKKKNVIKADDHQLDLQVEEGDDHDQWWVQSVEDWIKLLKLSAACCLTICLEWWCYEILILLTGWLPDAKRKLSVLTVVLNFDYLLYSIILSLSTCASTRVSNELGAGEARAASESAYVSLGLGIVAGFAGGAAMVSSRKRWGRLFSREKGVVEGAKKMMLLMALVEVVNFPLAVAGGIVRATARPWLSIYASVGGFYLVALPIAVVMAFRVRLGLGGLLMGLLVGTVTSAIIIVVCIAFTDWSAEAKKAQSLVGHEEEDDIIRSTEINSSIQEDRRNIFFRPIHLIAEFFSVPKSCPRYFV